jgi:hypothetical protein
VRGTPLKNMRLDDIIEEIRPEFSWVDFDEEKEKILAWLQKNPRRILNKRFVLNWVRKHPDPGNEKKDRFVTVEMVQAYCAEIKWNKLAKYAWGRLMSSTWYGVPITNKFDFESAMEVIQDDYARILRER